MRETAEAHSVHLDTNRNITIEIANLSNKYCLSNPRVFMDTGFAYSPPQPTIRTHHTEVFSFTKDDHTATGTSGVFTYELVEMNTCCCTEVMVVMFSVPFDCNLYDQCFGVGIFDQSEKCNKELFDKMYQKKDEAHSHRHKADGGGEKFKGTEVEVRGCMSEEGRAIMKLEVFDRMY